MKIRVFKIFGHEVLRIETHQEATVSDVVQAILANRLSGVELVEVEDDEDEYGDVVEGLIPCECCGEMFEPGEVELDEEAEEVNARFADLTERLIWGPVPEEEPDSEDS